MGRSTRFHPISKREERSYSFHSYGVLVPADWSFDLLQQQVRISLSLCRLKALLCCNKNVGVCMCVSFFLPADWSFDLLQQQARISLSLCRLKALLCCSKNVGVCMCVSFFLYRLNLLGLPQEVCLSLFLCKLNHLILLQQQLFPSLCRLNLLVCCSKNIWLSLPPQIEPLDLLQ